MPHGEIYYKVSSGDKRYILIKIAPREKRYINTCSLKTK